MRSQIKSNVFLILNNTKIFNLIHKLKHIAKNFIIMGTATFLFYSPSMAATTNLFTLYRTNYFPEKTYSYQLEYDEQSCRITAKHPISVFFISTSTGAKLKGFSGYNKEYFQAQSINSPNAQSLTFSFKAIRELESILKQRLQIQLQLTKTENSCRIQTNFLTNGQILVSDLKKIDVEFVLKNQPPFGLQPANINWLKLFSSKTSKCLTGMCS